MTIFFLRSEPKEIATTGIYVRSDPTQNSLGLGREDLWNFLWQPFILKYSQFIFFGGGGVNLKDTCFSSFHLKWYLKWYILAFVIYIKKYLKAKEEELWKLKYFTMQTLNLNPIQESSKKNQNPSRYYYNSIITNLKFQTQAKISSFKNLHIKIDLLLLLHGPKSLKLP